MVTRCVCHDISFESLKTLADAEGLDLNGLIHRTGCCTSCGTCEPYVRLMLRTGRTCLPILDRRACDELMRSSATALRVERTDESST